MKTPYQVTIVILVLFPAITLNGENALVKLLVKWRLGENDPPEDVINKKDTTIDLRKTCSKQAKKINKKSKNHGSPIFQPGASSHSEGVPIVSTETSRSS